MKVIGNLFFLLILTFVSSMTVYSQISITDLNAKTENFNSMGSSATASLPSGWVVNSFTLYSTGTTATTHAAGTSGTGILTGSSSGGAYNFADGVTASSTDRALGFLTSGSYTSPRSIMVKIDNNYSETITELSVSWNYEKYRSGTRAFDFTFFTSTNGTDWTANTSGDQSYAADANNTTILNPPTSINKSFSLTGLSITIGSSFYLRWTYTGVGGNTNAQGLGIDNFSIQATAVLPVELTSFTASSVNGTVILNWATATEVSNYGFEVERSADKSVWNKIGFVAGNGNSNSVKTYSYSDNTASSGTVYYRLKQMDTDGKYEYSKVVSVNNTTPDAFVVDQNFPNPFNPSTTIRFSLANSSNVKVDVYSSIGELVHTLANQTYEAGNHAINFDASQLSAGIYLYRITAIDAAGKTFSAVKKMQLIK